MVRRFAPHFCLIVDTNDGFLRHSPSKWQANQLIAHLRFHSATPPVANSTSLRPNQRHANASSRR
jgi:hypothetical protein